MIKAMKKLKFWPRKKRKKKTPQPLPYYPPPPTRPPPPPPPLPPPPPPSHYWCCSCLKAEPSAPPLQSSWYDSGEAHQSLLATGVQAAAAPEFEYPALSGDERSSSYQQYMVPNPVYGIPVSAQAPRTQRSGGVFGCVVNFGMHLFRCFFPCYRIREV